MSERSSTWKRERRNDLFSMPKGLLCYVSRWIFKGSLLNAFQSPLSRYTCMSCIGIPGIHYSDSQTSANTLYDYFQEFPGQSKRKTIRSNQKSRSDENATPGHPSGPKGQNKRTTARPTSPCKSHLRRRRKDLLVSQGTSERALCRLNHSFLNFVCRRSLLEEQSTCSQLSFRWALQTW